MWKLLFISFYVLQVPVETEAINSDGQSINIVQATARKRKQGFCKKNKEAEKCKY